jgi:hypothetical protein
VGGSQRSSPARNVSVVLGTLSLGRVRIAQSRIGERSMSGRLVGTQSGNCDPRKSGATPESLSDRSWNGES